MMPPEGKHWQYTPEKLTQLDEAGDIYWSPNGNPRRKVYCDAEKGVPIQDLWLNYRDSINQQMKTTGYPTEKNIDMLRMIVQASSESGDYVMDCFAGGGTTLGAAQELGRQWIGADNSPESLSAVIRRFRDGLQDYGDYVSKPFDQPELTLKTETDDTRFSLFSEHAKTDEALSIIKSVGYEWGRRIPRPHSYQLRVEMTCQFRFNRAKKYPDRNGRDIRKGCRLVVHADAVLVD